MSLCKNRLAVALAYALFGCASLAAVPQASAQDDVPAASESARRTATDLDAVTVTAQSREQEIQDVPIALQVVDDQMLDDIAAEDLGDIDSFVPGLEVSSVQPTQPSFKLRGIETDDFGIGTDPAVGIFVDGVYGGRGGGVLLPFVDVERIEVLKGPQGTLFGRNTAAGAISLITRRPQDEVEARASLRLGNYGKQYAEAMWNVPTGDNSALRFNALVNHSDGWIEDGATGEDLGGEDNWATRAGWQVRMGDNTTALLSWDHESLDQNGRPTTGVVPLPAAPDRPGAPADPDSYVDPRDAQTFSDTDVSAEWRTFDGVSLIVDHAFGWSTLTSTTSWRQYDSLNQVEEDATNRFDLYIDSTNTESNESFYQEFKFAGSSERFDWVAGASYFKEEAEQTSEVNTNTTTVDNIVRNLGMAPMPNDLGLYGFTTFLAQTFGIPVDLLGQRWNEQFQNSLETTAYAAFGDVIWHVNDKLNLTVGLRYTRDEKDFSWLNNPRTAPELDAQLAFLESVGFFDAINGIGIPITRDLLTFDIAFIDPPAMENKGVLVRDSDSWSDFSPRFVVDYHFNADGMVFASLAKGYKAGGYNALQIGPAFDNEDVWNLESGIKQAFDNRLSYNASLFYYNYDNRQSVRLIDPDPTNPTDIPRFVIDTGDLEAWGVDFDTRWQVTDAFGFDFQMEWIDSTYKNYSTPEGVNLDGQPTGEPELSASVGASYVFDLGGSGDLRFSARHAYRGERRCNDGSELQGDCGSSSALDLGEAQERTDVRVGWTSPRGHWGWAVYGNNVFDNRYVTGLNTYGKDVLGVVGAGVTAPRTYGLEVSVKY